MEFTVAAFGSSLFVFLLILHESYTFLDPVLLPIVCAPDFVFGFLLCQANFHMDYLLHGIYCSHYFCCFFPVVFIAEFVQVHIFWLEDYAHCHVTRALNLYVNRFTLFFWFLHSTPLRHICTIAGDSILGFVWLLFSFSLNNLHAFVVPFGPGRTLYNFVLGDFRFGPNRTFCIIVWTSLPRNAVGPIEITEIFGNCLCAGRHPLCFRLVR